MHVLIVDDEIPIVNLLAEVLSDEGHTIEKAHDGETALGLVRAGLRPNLVIMDVMMPKLDGLGLYAALRSEFVDAPIGVLLISAGKRVQLNDERAMFLPKPFNIPDLLDAIDRLTA